MRFTIAGLLVLGMARSTHKDFHVRSNSDWFFGLVEGHWREFYNVQDSGFFDRSNPLPAVPKGLLKIPDKI